MSSVIVVISMVRVAFGNPTLTRSTAVTTAVDKSSASAVGSSVLRHGRSD